MHCQGVQGQFIRSEGVNKKVFEIQGTRKWLKDLKQRKDIKKMKYFKKCNSFKITNGKLYAELNPAAKSECTSKLRKIVKNTGDKFKVFIKAYTMNAEPYFSI